jgi:nicotinamidase-related amidase
MSKHALILVDIQNDYFPDGLLPVVGVEAAADNAAKLLTGFRRAGGFLVHIRHEFPSADAPFFKPDSEGSKINTRVLPQDGENVILKRYANAFRDTDLKSILDENEIDDLVICGDMSHLCIDATARAAADLGYTVTVIHDACASRDLDFEGVVVPAAHVHAGYMAALKVGYASVVSTQEFIRANTPA